MFPSLLPFTMPPYIFKHFAPLMLTPKKILNKQNYPKITPKLKKIPKYIKTKKGITCC